MQIIVNHLTRMKTQSRICVAGIERDTLAHIRPVTPPDDLITRTLLRDNGGPFGIGALVDLGPVTPQPNPPETEDHRFHTARARLIRQLTADGYWAMLDKIQVGSLQNAFGSNLEERGRGYAVEAGRGDRSLAVLPIRGRPRLAVDRYGKVRLSLRYPDPEASFSVADVRLCEADHVTIREDVVSAVDARLRRGVDAYMMLGLARAFQADGDDRERHYVQVNGLCLADNPVGDLP
jgi:putative nucleic acid modification protein with dual OB domain